jgi:hypothetical protein
VAVWLAGRLAGRLAGCWQLGCWLLAGWLLAGWLGAGRLAGWLAAGWLASSPQLPHRCRGVSEIPHGRSEGTVDLRARDIGNLGFSELSLDAIILGFSKKPSHVRSVSARFYALSKV